METHKKKNVPEVTSKSKISSCIWIEEEEDAQVGSKLLKFLK
jgi:hypothetical protein